MIIIRSKKEIIYKCLICGARFTFEELSKEIRGSCPNCNHSVYVKEVGNIKRVTRAR